MLKKFNVFSRNPSPSLLDAIFYAREILLNQYIYIEGHDFIGRVFNIDSQFPRIYLEINHKDYFYGWDIENDKIYYSNNKDELEILKEAKL